MSEPAVQSVAIREVDVARHRQISSFAISIPRGQAWVVGKEADLAIGVEPPDPGVSRRALAIAASADGWRLTIHTKSHPRTPCSCSARRPPIAMAPWCICGDRPRPGLTLGVS